MEFNSFKELLLKKAGDNGDLQALIRFISNDVLAEEIIESLEKMASHKGDKANSAITGWAGSATGADANMLHDAISHHLSHFAARNKANPAKVSDVEKKISMTDHSKGGQKQELPYQTKHHEMDPIAAQHLERAMHLSDLAARAGKHSLGKINFEHVPTQAWEMNETSPHQRVNQHGQKKYADDQQGLKRRLQGKGAKRFENHGYLMMDPHEKYANKGKLQGHQGAYPFEEMKVNDKHVDIDHDMPASDKYEPHAFDSHPMFHKEGKTPAWERPESDRSDADREAYSKNLENWQDSPQFNNWLDQQEARETKDPKAYAERGSKPSKPLLGDAVRKGTPVAQEAAAEPEAEEPQQAQQQEAAPVQAAPRKNVVRRQKSGDTAANGQKLMDVERALKNDPKNPDLLTQKQELINQLSGKK